MIRSSLTGRVLSHVAPSAALSVLGRTSSSAGHHVAQLGCDHTPENAVHNVADVAHLCTSVCHASVIEVGFSQPEARAASLHTSCTAGERDITVGAMIERDMTAIG